MNDRLISIQAEFAPTPPYETDENWFESFVGNFVVPVLKTELVEQYWFSRYGDSTRREVRVRFRAEAASEINASQKSEPATKLEAAIEDRIKALGFKILSYENRLRLKKRRNRVVGAPFNDLLVSGELDLHRKGLPSLKNASMRIQHA